MYGTEKQIAYAEDIIFKAYAHIDSIIDHFKEENNTCSKKWIPMNNDVIYAADHVREWIDDCVNRVDDAYKWIAMKNMFSVPQINQKINKYTRYLSKRRGSIESIQLDVYYKP